ncbi:MAG: glucuronate isomerase [Chitinophagaceae bacterium]|nr:glucuronate isomerase [Chitinophagaceae bacterium]
MKSFNDNDFLLMNDYGRRLYHEEVKLLPIVDPHNHIDPAALASNRKFENIYQLWVQNDPYKHRAMRIYGVAEKLITGNEPEYDKFLAWASCFPSTAGNPLFHWSCMELNTLFGISDILNPFNARQIWETANERLQEKEFTAPGIITKFNVELLCTSDDLLDSLEHHAELGRQASGIICLPSLRGDSIISLDDPSFFTWLKKLETLTSGAILDLESYLSAVSKRLDFFDLAGCLLSDHSLDSGFMYRNCTDTTASALFTKILKKETLSAEEINGVQSYLLVFLGRQYAGRKWKMQLHIGAYRYTSSVLRAKVGPAGGYACIGHTADIRSICSLLDELDKGGTLPKTILYTLNPADNAAFATITGSYSEDGIQGKIQFGPAWWYNDHYEGIMQQLLALSSYGLLATSIGMTTDSRSIVSFVRHNYYRRILCNLLGSWVEEGKLPDDWAFVSAMAKNISYNNIKSWIKK